MQFGISCAQTDPLLAQITKHMVIFDPNSGDEVAEVFISPPEWKVYIEGNLANAPVSFRHYTNASPQSYAIEIHRIINKNHGPDLYEAMRLRHTGLLYYGRSNNAVFFGELRDPNGIRRLAQRYFSILY